jgi:hypothetical protein
VVRHTPGSTETPVTNHGIRRLWNRERPLKRTRPINRTRNLTRFLVCTGRPESELLLVTISLCLATKNPVTSDLELLTSSTMVSGLFNVEKQVRWPAMARVGSLNLCQLVFYGAYHSNKINVLIHIICVPLIVW